MKVSGKMEKKGKGLGTLASYISGTGMCVPDKVVGNDYFASYLDTSDEWIRGRTGIQERRWAEPDVATSEVALPAAISALENAGLNKNQIDGIIVATVTPDYVFPSTACCVQKRLGLSKGFAFDVNAVCSGFVYALVTADGLIRSGVARHILVIGAELFSRIIDMKDRSTCVLFGDGAGACVLSAVDKEAEDEGKDIKSQQVRGLIAAELHADGNYGGILNVPLGTASPATACSLSAREHFLTMQGREVFKLAVKSLHEVSDSLLKRFDLLPGDIDYYITHQANERILRSVARMLKLEESQLLMNLDKYGNTSAASLPILMAEASRSGALKPGDLALMTAFGGGITWGAVLLRW